MREILFRGKRVDNGKWVEGDYFTDQIAKGSNPCVDISIIRNDLHEDFEVNPKTIGQFIGLHDKNGKKVFGGDKIYVDCSEVGGSFEDGVYIVKYFLPDCGFYLETTDKKNAIKFNECYLYEVLGNIYDKEGNNG
jgi:uncharacterized phage protein (TIGR01671 family)